ncbi:RAD52 family DNA repair protein [Kaistia sp. MMO-174]|uniref:RAD52 family DNA repair protein n=1 Tax=Kaistia sp. MMO-174 TaxID=3081256 RepID=UPI00301ADC73
MAFTPEQTKLLSAKLSPDSIKSREQAGRKLSYIEGWHAIAEANRIFGFDAWQRETVELRLLGEPSVGKDKNGKDQWRVNYMARVRITVGGVVRDGCGFGQGIDKDVGQAHESALKEAETDAMKRALMTFGNPFGLALYDKAQENVGHEPEPEDRLILEALLTALNQAGSKDEVRIWLGGQKREINGLSPTQRAEFDRALDKAKSELPETLSEAA